jgi:hypothetical protein
VSGKWEAFSASSVESADASRETLPGDGRRKRRHVVLAA